jgi:hypothetical protein
MYAAERVPGVLYETLYISSESFVILTQIRYHVNFRRVKADSERRKVGTVLSRMPVLL